jgi:hypothetical protein
VGNVLKLVVFEKKYFSFWNTSGQLIKTSINSIVFKHPVALIYLSYTI